MKPIDSVFHQQLIDRRYKLETALSASRARADLTALLSEVDAAFARLNVGTYGLCEACHDPVETDRLLANI